MKKLIFLLIAASFISCKKESPTVCYECMLQSADPIPAQYIEYCGADGKNHSFKDEQGRPMFAICTQK